MSGHSKWANIKHRKEKADSFKGRIFTKLGRELAMAVRGGGADPVSNYKLADVIAKAKAQNMPNDNISRSIKKAAGDGDGSKFEEVTYEGYGPCGVAVIVEASTDNRNRTASDLRHFFDKYGGNLGTTGCVSFMFDKKGILIIERKSGHDDEKIMMEAIETGADDFNSEDEFLEITTSPVNFSNVRRELESKGYEFVEAAVKMIPVSTSRIDDAKMVENMENLIERIEELDDVIEVWHNWESDE